MIDKFKTCKDCPDRVLGCHDTCEGYLARCKQREEIRKNRMEAQQIIEYETERAARYRKLYRDRGYRRKIYRS